VRTLSQGYEGLHLCRFFFLLLFRLPLCGLLGLGVLHFELRRVELLDHLDLWLLEGGYLPVVGLVLAVPRAGLVRQPGVVLRPRNRLAGDLNRILLLNHLDVGSRLPLGGAP